MTVFALGMINGRWPLMLPRHRVDFHAVRPTWEAGRLASCAERIQPGMTVYDIGAEHGDFTALYQQWVGPEGIVVPFEPSPPYWPCIRETFEANGMTPPRAWFAGFASNATQLHPTHLDIDLEVVDGWPACAWGPNSDEDIGRFRHLAQQTDSTPQARLDAFADITGLSPDVVIIDVEGAEFNVLDGMSGLLADARALSVYVSVHDIGDQFTSLFGWYGRTADDLDTLMAESGFTREELPYHGEGERFFLYERDA